MISPSLLSRTYVWTCLWSSWYSPWRIPHMDWDLKEVLGYMSMSRIRKRLSKYFHSTSLDSFQFKKQRIHPITILEVILNVQLSRANVWYKFSMIFVFMLTHISKMWLRFLRHKECYMWVWTTQLKATYKYRFNSLCWLV